MTNYAGIYICTKEEVICTYSLTCPRQTCNKYTIKLNIYMNNENIGVSSE